MRTILNRAIGRIVEGAYVSAATAHPDLYRVPASRIGSIAKRIAGQIGARIVSAGNAGRICSRSDLAAAFDAGLAQARQAHPDLEIGDVASFKKRVLGQVLVDLDRLTALGSAWSFSRRGEGRTVRLHRPANYSLR